MAGAQIAELLGTFVRTDLPELVSLSVDVLRKVPLAHALTGTLDRAQCLHLVPVACSVLLGCALAHSAVDGVHEALCRRLGLHGRSVSTPPPSTYWITRIVLLRGMGLIYLSVFATSADQSRALFGEFGLSPALPRAPNGRPAPAFTILESAGLHGDLALEALSWLGVTIALLVSFGGSRLLLWAPLWLWLWLSQLSLVNLGARVVMGYGWEWGTCELGLLVAFLCCEWPPESLVPRALPPPRVAVWLVRWFLFRLLIGAGQSKLGRNSSDCWLHLSCTATHYYTQPMPTALAWFFHKLPARVHELEGLLTFVEQLVLPFLMLFPSRRVRIVSCIAALAFQAAILLTGNYAWINWMALVPAFSLLDDESLSLFAPRTLVAAVAEAVEAAGSPVPHGDHATASGIPCAQEGEGYEPWDDPAHSPYVPYEPLPQRASSERSDEEGDGERDEGGSSGGGASGTGTPDRDAAAAPPSAPPSAPLSRRRARSLYCCWRLLLHGTLLVVIGCKSAAPLKELFSAAPWLHFYDDYYLVNAQARLTPHSPPPLVTLHSSH